VLLLLALAMPTVLLLLLFLLLLLQLWLLLFADQPPYPPPFSHMRHTPVSRTARCRAPGCLLHPAAGCPGQAPVGVKGVAGCCEV
jgi:hypothetical protein